MILGIVLFIIGHTISMTITSIFYHRALAHQAIVLPKWLVKFVSYFGAPITGIDPKSWVCMHRMHHMYSDTPEDPHSPVTYGPLGVFFAQHKSFERTISRLLRKDPNYTRLVEDIPFDVHWLNRKKLWWMPFVLHLAVAILISAVADHWAAGTGYFLGIAGHPVQGYLVNSFAHWFGYTNYDCGDNSKNNTLVAWAIFGEGYQNNHHIYPSSPKFAMRWFEIDFGYYWANFLSFFGLFKIKKDNIPAV